MAMKTIEH